MRAWNFKIFSNIVDNLNEFLAIRTRAVNSKIFSNHGEQFKCIVTQLVWVNSQIFSSHGGQFKSIFAQLLWVNSIIFSNHGGQFKCIFAQLLWVNSKIYSNHGGQFKSIFSQLLWQGGHSLEKTGNTWNLGMQPGKPGKRGIFLKIPGKS